MCCSLYVMIFGCDVWGGLGMWGIVLLFFWVVVKGW